MIDAETIGTFKVCSVAPLQNNFVQRGVMCIPPKLSDIGEYAALVFAEVLIGRAMHIA